ncbi:MAG TPA: holo-ACP synthase [Anaerolineae bacterium]|nr:holo-ACP synthase [Anaerolineae bacterium]HQH38250.1 holo-ACP synthase [Anaerolineae bacterium]
MLTTGVDLVDIPRLERVLHRCGEKFLTRIYTPDEVLYSRGRTTELAVRFAAKEAVAKALGVGMRILAPAGIDWLDVETLNEMSGKPYIVLHGRARMLAEAQGLTEWAISLSHDGGIAMALVVATGKT